MEHVGRRHHSSPYPVRAGPVLVRRNIGMPPSDLLTAGPAPTYLHPVPRHLGSGNRRNVGCVDNPHSLMLESASTSGAGVLSHRHLYKRLGDFIGRRRLSVAERPHTRLAAGTLGSAASPTLGERSRLALSCSLELGDLLVQLFLGRRQLRNLPLQLRDQPHQLVTLRGREVFGLTHSQSIKTCSVPHNPPTDADPANQLPSLYRPFVVKHHFANFTMNDVLTRNHYQMFGEDLTQQNKVLNLCSNGRYFYTLASDKLTDLHFTGDTQCLPLYRYTEDGEPVSNITQWGIDHINGHYRREWDEEFQSLAGEEGITAEQIFAYTYAVLHNPAYRHEYAVDLLREFPRLPLYPDFHHWVEMGQKLLDLHIGFESAEPYPLERHDREGVDPKRAILRADKSRGTITLDERTTLAGVPEKAWEYRLGSRSALEWVLDQYKERKPRDPTIREKFNNYRFSDHKERVIDLLRRVCTVSVATIEVVDSMAQHENVSQSTGDPCPSTRTSSP